MGVGGLCGFVNGFVVEQWKVPSFIVTLGMLNVASGAARVVSNNATITGLPQPFIDFGNLIVFGVFPSIFLIAVGLILIGWFVLGFTVFGRFIYAIGTNEEAVRLSGHNPRTYKIAAFVISGLTAGVAAMVYLLRLNVGSPIAGVGYELNAIAAVIIGGTSLAGGKGSIIGTLVGACIIQVLSTGLQLFGVGDNVKPIVIGTVIVLAVVLDAYRDRCGRVPVRRRRGIVERLECLGTVRRPSSSRARAAASARRARGSFTRTAGTSSRRCAAPRRKPICSRRSG
jgi:ribose transport system permease protein